VKTSGCTDSPGTDTATVAPGADSAAVAPQPRPRPKRVPRAPRWWADLAALVANGTPITAAAAQVGHSRSSAHRAAADPRWAGLLAAAERAAASEAARLLALGRPAAVRALTAALGPEAGTSPSERLDAAKALLQASAPPAESVRRAVRAELVRALPSKLRQQVVDALAGRVDLASLTDEELAALAGESEAT
jgi:hypothetical protein